MNMILWRLRHAYWIRRACRRMNEYIDFAGTEHGYVLKMELLCLGVSYAELLTLDTPGRLWLIKRAFAECGFDPALRACHGVNIFGCRAWHHVWIDIADGV
jgi:hypothetical protein